MRLTRTPVVGLVLGVALCVIPSATRAQSEPSLSIELNDMSTVGEACRVTFLIRNGLESAISDLAFELVLFGKDSRILRLVSVSAGRLPLGKSRVRQFDLKGVRCDAVGRVLLNDITRCGAKPLTPERCLDATRATSRTDMPFIT